MPLLQEMVITLFFTTTILTLISILMFRRGWIGPSSDGIHNIKPSQDEEPLNLGKLAIVIGGTILIAILLLAYVIYLP